MGLKFKIFMGYSILIAILAFTVYFFRKEQIKKNTLRKGETELLQRHQLTQKIYIDFLELASQAEVAITWNEKDLSEYRQKREDVCNTLQILRNYVRLPEQQARIDTLCFLLQEKEHLLSTTMMTFRELEEVSDIVRKKIPVIVSKVQNQLKRESKTDETNDKTKLPQKRKNFLGLFRKKSQSAYLQQKEKSRQKESPTSSQVKNTATMLYSLNREVMEKQEERQESLLAQMDSLYAHSIGLNHKMNNLAMDFEQNANERLSTQYKAFRAEREEAYYIVAGLAIFISLIAIILYIIVHRDLNRLFDYERKLECSNQKNKELLKSRKNMMLTIAHDLRSPLATIKGCAELLPGEVEKSKQDEYAKNILHSSDYMLELVNTLIDFYLLDAGKRKQTISIFHLETLFMEITRNYASLVKTKKLRLTTDFSGLNIVVSGDRPSIQQIVNNLLSNAIKFTQQGEIHLQAEYNNGELRFSVQDTGMGIAKEEKERIFTAFERLDNARNIPGFGLGLAISAKLVSQMGGSITVKSELNEGSTLMVFLPFSPIDNLTRIDQEPMLVDYHLEGIWVLVIDDDLIQLTITKEMLIRNKIKCDCCQTSWELITKLRTQKYDLLITDIQMPETDGYGILELLRSSNMETAKNMPVIAVTALIENETEYIASGFARCIHKPFSMDELMNTIAQVVKKKDDSEWKPDFSLILSDEDNRKEMLDIFITETERNLQALKKASDKHNKEQVSFILHKNLPLWQTVCLDYPLSRLRELITCPADNWTDKQYMEIREISNAVERLVAYAKKIREADE